MDLQSGQSQDDQEDRLHQGRHRVPVGAGVLRRFQPLQDLAGNADRRFLGVDITPTKEGYKVFTTNIPQRIKELLPQQEYLPLRQLPTVV